MGRLILYALVLISGTYLIYRFYSTFTANTASAHKTFKRIVETKNTNKNKIKARTKTASLLKSLVIYTKDLKIFNHSKSKMEDLEYIALRLDFVWHDVHLTEEHLCAILDLISLVYLGLIFILSLFNLKLIFLAVFYRFVPNLIISYWVAQIRERDKAIQEDFYEFHARIYHIYKHKQNQNIPIPDVFMRYYNSANPELKRMIELFRADYKVAPDKALDRMKAHYRIDKVYRLCNELLLIQTGRTVEPELLESFQTELLAEHRLKQQREIEKKKEKGAQIFNLNMFILIEVIFLWTMSILVLNH